METRQNGSLEGEFEYESEGEYEGELEGEGEFEYEFEGELEGEGEFEYESEGEYEGELEGEGEFEGEEFFRRIRRAARGIGGFVQRAAPVLRNIARVAAPIVGRAVGTALGGPVGMQLGGMVGNVAATALREGELEYELEGEGEYEAELEGETELEGEMEAPITRQQALGELMAAVAARAQTEAEAESMAGAATVATLSPADRAALRRVLPNLVRGTAILTRILRRRRITRPAIRAVPTIVRRTAQTLARRAAAGRPVTRRNAAQVMATQTRRVLSSPRTCANALRRNVRATRVVARSPQQPRRSTQPMRG